MAYPGEIRAAQARNYMMPLTLLAVAALGWWLSVATSSSMTPSMNVSGVMVAMSLSSFMVAWVAMMAAMMLPAVLPVVRLYQRAAARGAVAPAAYFIAGYAVIWSAVGLPTYVAWRYLQLPLSQATPTVGRVVGTVLIGAAVYQFSPLKASCLRHCRSPLNFFMAHARNLRSDAGALTLGVRHGLYCLGCCWMLMAVLVAFGTMQLAWMAIVALLVFIEKVTSVGEYVAKGAGMIFLALGVVLLIAPTTVGTLT